MKFIAAILIVSSFSASAITCRQAVVDARSALEAPIGELEFSVYAPSEFGMSMEDFNLLSSEEQSALFLKLLPMETMVEKTKARLEANISYLQKNPYSAIFFEGKIHELKTKRDALIACEM